MFEYLNPAAGPVIEGLEGHEVTYAKTQKEYRPLRTLRGRTEQVPVLTRWDLTPQQRQAIAHGADIFLELLTFGSPLQPIVMAVGEPNADFYRERFGLPQLPWATPEMVIVHEAGDVIGGIQKCRRCGDALLDYTNVVVVHGDDRMLWWRPGSLVAVKGGCSYLTGPLDPHEAMCKEE